MEAAIPGILWHCEYSDRTGVSSGHSILWRMRPAADNLGVNIIGSGHF